MVALAGKVARPLSIRVNHGVVSIEEVCEGIWNKFERPKRLFTVVQSLGYGIADVCLQDEESFFKLCELCSLDVKGQRCNFSAIDDYVKVIHVKYLPGEMANSYVNEALLEYGEIVSIVNEKKVLEYCGEQICTGTRIVKIKMKKIVPNYVQIGMYKAMCEYNGVKKVCRKCERPGHVAKTCPHIVCRNCGKVGHIEKKCTESCANCKSVGHCRSSCPVPKWANKTSGLKNKIVEKKEETESGIEVDLLSASNNEEDGNKNGEARVRRTETTGETADIKRESVGRSHNQNGHEERSCEGKKGGNMKNVWGGDENPLTIEEEGRRGQYEYTTEEAEETDELVETPDWDFGSEAEAEEMTRLEQLEEEMRAGLELVETDEDEVAEIQEVDDWMRTKGHKYALTEADFHAVRFKRMREVYTRNGKKPVTWERYKEMFDTERQRRKENGR